MHDSVTVHMQAPPDQVWDLVSDVTRIGSYSPETFEAEWLDGATGPAVGRQVPWARQAQRQGPDLLDDLRGHRPACPGPSSASTCCRGQGHQHLGLPDRARPTAGPT